LGWLTDPVRWRKNKRRKLECLHPDYLREDIPQALAVTNQCTLGSVAQREAKEVYLNESSMKTVPFPLLDIRRIIMTKQS
jgi:hypothetical protein